MRARLRLTDDEKTISNSRTRDQSRSGAHGTDKTPASAVRVMENAIVHLEHAYSLHTKIIHGRLRGPGVGVIEHELVYICSIIIVLFITINSTKSIYSTKHESLKKLLRPEI